MSIALSTVPSPLSDGGQADVFALASSREKVSKDPLNRALNKLDRWAMGCMVSATAGWGWVPSCFSRPSSLRLALGLSRRGRSRRRHIADRCRTVLVLIYQEQCISAVREARAIWLEEAADVDDGECFTDTILVREQATGGSRL